jgi:DNA-binding transcriptional MerR regulator
VLQKKYYTIGEVADMFGVTTSLVRYWEKRFKQLKPQKQQGIRKYTADDIAQLRKIFELVKERGYTLRGAQEALRPLGGKAAKKSEVLKNLKDIRHFLETCQQKTECM